jgi:outer membrane receptor protein involved in Fe transport
MSNKLLFTWIFLLISHVIPATAMDINQLRQISLEELMQITIVGSTLTDESIKTVPSAVTVFTQEQIKQMGFDYLHELLDLVPGYQSQRGENTKTYSYSARGRRNGAQSKEILLLMDGRILNDPRVGSSNPVRTHLAQIERVEVIRGPGSALYGSGAYTGVINIITRQDINEIKLGMGSFHQWDGHVLAKKEWNAWHFDLYAQANQDQGQIYRVDDNFNPDPSVRIDTRDPQRTAVVDLSIRYENTRLRLSRREENNEGFYVIEALSENFNQSDHRVEQVSLEQDFDGSGNFRSHLMLGWQQTTQRLDTQAMAAGALAAISEPSSDAPLLGKLNQVSQYWQFKWHNDWQLSTQSSVQFGLEWINNKETEAYVANNFDIGQLVTRNYPIRYYGNFDHTSPVGLLRSQRSFGVYGQYLHRFTDDTYLTLGLRYDNYDEIDARLSPRVGLVHSFNKINTLKLLYGEAFRAPSLNETGLINNPIVLGNVNLTHEIVKTWDIIWLVHTKNAYLSIGGFINDYQHPIAGIFINKNIRSFDNVESSEAHGFELEANYQVNDQWLLRGTLTHFTRLPDTSFREADTLASLLVNYGKGQWNWNVTGVYHGNRDMLNGMLKQTLSDYWLFNTKLHYQFDKSWLAYAQIKNLFDQAYESAPQGNRLVEGIPNRGREWGIGIGYQF